MASRSNLSGRPGMSGILNRVMNPMQRQARSMREKIAAPEVAATPEIAAEQGGGGMSGMVGRALAAGKERQAELANRAVKPQAPPQAPRQGGGIRQALARGTKAKSAMQPAVAGQKRGPRRQPTAREQAMRTQAATASTRGQAQSQRGALEQMGATQEEVAAPGARGMAERAAAGAARGRGILSAEDQAARSRAALEETGEVGGTRTETPVTEPSLNKARRNRSRSGRIYR